MAGAIFVGSMRARTQRHVHLHLFGQLTFATDTVQIAYKKQLEQHHQIDLWTSSAGTIKLSHLIVDEVADLGHP